MTKVQLLVAVVAISLVGCSRTDDEQEPPSAIVALVEKAGLGPVKKSDDQQLSRFLNTNTPVTLRAWELCAPLVKTKVGTPWERTSEGRVCKAAQWAYKPRTPTPSESIKGGTL
jgi:hypothetical protein